MIHQLVLGALLKTTRLRVIAQKDIEVFSALNAKITSCATPASIVANVPKCGKMH